MRLALIAAMVLMAAPVWADEVAVRLGAHDGYGRVVFDVPAAIGFTTTRSGDVVTLHFAKAGAIASASGGTRNVSAVTGGQDTASITVAPGTRLRTARFGDRVVVDVLDRAKPAVHAAKAKEPPAPAPPAAMAEPPAQPPAPAVQPTAPIAQPAPVAPVTRLPDPAPPQPATPSPQPAEPLGLAAAFVTLPAGEGGDAALLPFGASTGAAAFRHGAEGWAVFDERGPIDLAPLAGDPVLSGASVTLLPAGTLVRLPIAPGRELRLSRQPAGWTLIVSATAAPLETMAPQNRSQGLLLPVAAPGEVMTLADADTGQNLLVGTVRAMAGGAGPAVPVAYRVPEFSILPSWQGLVVEPLSDRTALRAVKEGFAIETGDPLSPAPDAARSLEAAAVLTRRFDLPDEPARVLMRRLQGRMEDEGNAPAQSRLLPRKAAAQVMLALGLGAEAQSLLTLAVADDPRAADDPDMAGLAAIAALLSGRPAEADGLLNPALGGSDEVALWRAVRAAMLQPGSPEAASMFATTVGLVLTYPAALRDRLLPLAAETMAEGGASAAADALLAKLPDEPLLAFARAMRLAAKGDTAAALTTYDALAAGRDRLVSARAATRASLLRLDTGAIGPAEAAAALERGFMSWRGDNRERDLRLRVAGLRGQAGQWRAALGLLRETAALYPGDSALIQARMAALLKVLLNGPAAASVAPLDLVAIAEENAEAVAQADPAASAALLADKLTALDLPRRAGPIIARMMNAAQPGVDRASLGARLAAMRLGEGDAAGAAAALDASDAPDLPPALLAERGLTLARIRAANHDPGGAAAILSGIDTPAADDLRATVLGDAGDWRGAQAALASLAARRVPAKGTLDAGQQDILVRLASAQARAGDDAALRALGASEATRMTGPRGDMFRLLTAAPVSGVGDLRRAAGEMALARAVPADLAAIGSR